jgi:uncharacterized membrane protein YoaK (UPF0700 family)
MTTVTPVPRSPRVPDVLLAGAAGAVDLVALLHVGGSFASVVTGNLVLVGAGIALLDLHRLLAPAVAVAGFAAGVAACALVWRRAADAVAGPLAVELVLLCTALGVEALVSGRPALVTLVLLSTAMGAQSVAGLGLRAATTYMTGALTTSLHGLLTGTGDPVRRRAWTAAWQLAALVTGAVTAAVLSAAVRWLPLVLPVVLVGVAITVVARRPVPR